MSIRLCDCLLLPFCWLFCYLQYDRLILIFVNQALCPSLLTAVRQGFMFHFIIKPLDLTITPNTVKLDLGTEYDVHL